MIVQRFDCARHAGMQDVAIERLDTVLCVNTFYLTLAIATTKIFAIYSTIVRLVLTYAQNRFIPQPKRHQTLYLTLKRRKSDAQAFAWRHQ